MENECSNNALPAPAWNPHIRQKCSFKRSTGHIVLKILVGRAYLLISGSRAHDVIGRFRNLAWLLSCDGQMNVSSACCNESP